MLGESCYLSEDIFITCTVVVLSKLLSGTGASKTVLSIATGRQPLPSRVAPRVALQTIADLCFNVEINVCNTLQALLSCIMFVLHR